MSAGYPGSGPIGRRRFVGTTATIGVAAATASIVGCSSSSSKSPSSTAPTTAAGTQAPAAAATRAATSAAAARTSTPAALDSTKGKPGGTFKFLLAQYPPRFTMLDFNNQYNHWGYTHSTLLAQAWGVASVAPDAFDALEPDVAQAMPEQPDQTTYVFKLRPNVKFHNGRIMTPQDVQYSLDRVANDPTSAWAPFWQTWFDHTEMPDSQTVVVKSKFPYVDGLIALAGNNSGAILAREFEESPDAKNKLLGSGPFMWVDAQPPVSITLKKNPDYYLKPYPYFDQMILLATTDPVARVADFTTKQVQMPWQQRADDAVTIHQQRPDAKEEDLITRAQAIFLRTDKPPFTDKRVRQALSMGIDRKKVRDTANAGIGREDQYFNVMYKDLLGTREVKDLGDAAKYWQYNPQAAKQLLAAAGLDKPIETQMVHWPASVVGQQLPDAATLTQAQWKDAGLVNCKDVVDPNFNSPPGTYDGIGYATADGINTGAPAFGLTIRNTWYWGPNGEHAGINTCNVNDPQLSQLAEKQVRQLNKQERSQTFRAMEDILAEQQYMPIMSSNAQYFFWDPSVQNVSVAIEQGSKRYMMKWWYA